MRTRGPAPGDTNRGTPARDGAAHTRRVVGPRGGRGGEYADPRGRSAMQKRWPELHGAQLRDTAETVHRWLQVIGKIRLALAPHVNHWWQATTYVTPRGLTSS